MTLPKIDHPTFQLVLPSSGKKITYRPFLVTEEKILLTAKQSGDPNDIIRAITRVIDNCVEDEGFSAEELPSFDMEYVFIQLRSKSIGNIIKIVVHDSDDKHEHEIEVNLDEVEVIKDEKHSNKIELTKDIGIVMKYPTPKMSEKINSADNEVEMTYQVIKNCIDSVYDEDKVYPWNESTDEEKDAFLSSLDTKAYKKLRDFIDTMPKLFHEVKYKNSKGKEQRVTFKNLTDFFTWD